jgi:hypothetical protein
VINNLIISEEIVRMSPGFELSGWPYLIVTKKPGLLNNIGRFDDHFIQFFALFHFILQEENLPGAFYGCYEGWFEPACLRQD